MVHYDGSMWRAVTPVVPSSTVLYGVWGSAANNFWAVGDNATILHYDGAAWSVVATGGSPGAYRGVGGSSASDVWIVGDSGAVFQKQ